MNVVRSLVASVVLALGSTASGQTFFFNNPGAIPDGGGGNMSYGAPRVMTATSNSANPIQDLTVTITMNHAFIGDLRIRLAYTPAGSATTTTAFVLNRVGVSGPGFGNPADLNGTYVFTLGATSILSAVAPLGNTQVLSTGAYAPVSSNFNGTHTVVEFADFFRGLSGTGTWTLTFDDGASPDTGAVSLASIALVSRPLPCLADFNSDGVVNTADLTFFLGRFGNLCP